MDSNYHIHVFNDTVVPATCKENGYTLHKCECGYEHKDNFTPVGEHSFQLAEETAPTCTEPGRKKYRCTVCGEEKEEVFSVGHSWGAWNISQHPTCTEKGVQVRLCERCGQVEEGEIEPKGHDLTSPKKSETQKGYIDYFCKNCGQTVTLPSSSQKTKNFFSKYKKIIGVAVSLVLVVGLFFATKDFFLPLYHYAHAESLIEQGEYDKAFFELRKCRGFKDSKELLKDFKVVYDGYFQRFYDEEGNVSLVYENKCEFNEYGDMTLHIQSVEGKNVVISYVKYGYEYDESGNMILKVSYNEDGTEYSEERYEYDEYGNIKAEYDKKGNVISKYEYEYDEFNNIIHQVTYDGAGRFTCKYDKYGNILHKISYDNDGNSYNEFKYSYEYDENGEIIKYARYDAEGNLDHISTYKYKYDIYGNITHRTCYYGEDDEFKYDYQEEYDKYGNLIRKSQKGQELKIEDINPRVVYCP